MTTNISHAAKQLTRLHGMYLRMPQTTPKMSVLDRMISLKMLQTTLLNGGPDPGKDLNP